MTENTTLAPDIRETTLGIRSARIHKVYPLSLASEQDILDNFIGVFAGFTSFTGLSDADLFISLKNTVFEQLEKLLDEVLEEPVPLTEITNPQAEALVEIVWEVNFASLFKKKAKYTQMFKELHKKLFSSIELSPESSPKPPTDSNTSTDLNTKKEDSQESK
jgi:hypothetical protein